MGFENEKIRFGFLLSGPKMVVNGIETSDDPCVREKFFRKWRERERKKNRNGIGKFEFLNLNLQKQQKNKRETIGLPVWKTFKQLQSKRLKVTLATTKTTTTDEQFTHVWT